MNLLVELSRKIENMIRLGTVAEVDHGARRVRVQSGELKTQWLKWRVARAGGTLTWEPPTIGEQVMILSPSGELANGVVMPSIYCDAHDSPGDSPDEHITQYPDGARVAYNHASGALAVTGIKTALIEASVSVTLKTPLTHCTQDLTVDGLLTYRNGLAGSGGENGSKIDGELAHSGDLKNSGSLSSNGIVLDKHTHGGVAAGGASTGTPK